MTNYMSSLFDSKSLLPFSWCGMWLVESSDARKRTYSVQVDNQSYYPMGLTSVNQYWPYYKETFNFDMAKMEYMLDCGFVEVPQHIRKASDIKKWILSQKI